MVKKIVFCLVFLILFSVSLLATGPATNLTATAKSDETVSRWALLSWTASTSAPNITYDIYMATWSVWNGEEEIITTTGIDVVSADIILNFSSKSTYYFYVVAIDAIPEESTRSNQAKCYFQPPAIPTGVTATALPGMVELQWNSINRFDIDGYKVYRSLSQASGYTLINIIGWQAPTAEEPYTITEDTGVVNGTKYYYKITSFYNYFENEEESGYSLVKDAVPFSDALPKTYITQPISSSTITGAGQYQIKGTATDNMAVYSVKLLIWGAGYYWNGSTWTASPTLLSAVQNSSGTIVNWYYNWLIPATTFYKPYFVVVFAEDNYEQIDEAGAYSVFYVNSTGIIPPDIIIDPEGRIIDPASVDISKTALDIIAFPNPVKVRSLVNVVYTIPADSSDVNIRIYNRIGEFIREIVDDRKNKGTYSRNIILKNDSEEYIAPGIYYIVLKTSKNKKIFKMEVRP